MFVFYLEPLLYLLPLPLLLLDVLLQGLQVAGRLRLALLLLLQLQLLPLQLPLHGVLPGADEVADLLVDVDDLLLSGHDTLLQLLQLTLDLHRGTITGWTVTRAVTGGSYKGRYRGHYIGPLEP